MAINIYKPDSIAALKFLAILVAPFALLIILFYGAVACLYLSTKFSPPVYSVSVSVPELNATIKLEFYGIWDESQESGRYLTVSTPKASIRGEIAGFDWAHNARTSIYVTPEHKIIVLGVHGADYIIDLRKNQLNELQTFASSVDWNYIGAFDFDESGHALQFFPASRQSECIPMRMSSDVYWSKMSRGSYRKEDCTLR